MSRSVFTDLSPAQVDVLIVVASADGWVNRGTITTRYQTRRASMTNPNEYIRTLVKHGYLEQGSNDRGDAKHRLSQKGRQVLVTLRADISTALEESQWAS